MKPATRARSRDLLRLARFHGVQASFVDTKGTARHASTPSLLAVLNALGAPLDSPEDARDALAQARGDAPTVDPVAVAWEGQGGALCVRASAFGAGGALTAVLQLEDGDRHDLRWRLDETLPVTPGDSGLRLLPLPPSLPLGYHRAIVNVLGGEAEVLVISAPRRAFRGRPAWGAFLPLYALHSTRSWGTGDLTDLDKLMRWVADAGDEAIGTLPLLASFLDGPVVEPSPYAPVSRLTWNELYADPARAPEAAASPRARDLAASETFQRAVAGMKSARVVDYREAYALKRQVLEALADECFAHDIGRERMERYAGERPIAAEYARFRATMERRGQPWREWPAAARQGRIDDVDFDERSYRYHLYAQALTEQQVAELGDHGDKAGLYLDLPVGVHGAGFDTWRYRSLFAGQASAGAPPDDFFTRGQDWGFPPFHPRGVREDRYRYFRAVVRHHLEHATALRIDHVMGLHRLYWIPPTLSAVEGVYVRYRPDEFYAILTLESQRHRAALFGEDLGTVPEAVRRAMRTHGLGGMYVAEFELLAGKGVLPPVPAGAVASVTTHDTPPFARYWRGADIDDRQAMGLLTGRQAVRERRQRQKVIDTASRRANAEGPGALLAAVHDHLARSRAGLMLINLEDLWLEEEPQNVPGTSTERPNWRQRARLSIEQMQRDTQVREALRQIAEARKQANP